jgi:putative flavoprotein involved in K+ transport
VTISVSGAHGGNTVDFRRLAAQGMTLVGMTQSIDNGVMHFASDLAKNLTRGDSNYLSMLDEADAYVARNGLDLRVERGARIIDPDPECVTDPIRELNLVRAGITSIIWATGFALDYRWLKVDVFDETGKPNHQRGVSVEPGIYFLGLPWLSRRASSFIWGVWHDAKYLADHISSQRKYRTYHPSAQRTTVDA